jgi:hypothetical protein
VGIATGYGLDGRGFGVSSPCRVKNFLLLTSSIPVMGPTQPPIKWVPGPLSSVVKRLGHKLTTHFQLVPRSRKCGSIHPLPHTPSWRGAQLVKHRDTFTLPLCFPLRNSGTCADQCKYVKRSLVPLRRTSKYSVASCETEHEIYMEPRLKHYFKIDSPYLQTPETETICVGWAEM